MEILPGLQVASRADKESIHRLLIDELTTGTRLNLIQIAPDDNQRVASLYNSQLFIKIGDLRKPAEVTQQGMKERFEDRSVILLKA